jgi:Lysine methyltransferase
VLTDLPYALDNLAANVERNALLWQDHSCSVSVLPLDWYSEDVGSLSGRSFDLILAADVVWLDELVPPLVRTLERLTISDTAQPSQLASSAASRSSSSIEAVSSIGSTSSHNSNSHHSTTILLSYQERSRATTVLLMRELQQCFTVQAVPSTQLHPQFTSDKITVYTIHRRLHTYLIARWKIRVRLSFVRLRNFRSKGLALDIRATVTRPVRCIFKCSYTCTTYYAHM